MLAYRKIWETVWEINPHSLTENCANYQIARFNWQVALNFPLLPTYHHFPENPNILELRRLGLRVGTISSGSGMDSVFLSGSDSEALPFPAWHLRISRIHCSFGRTPADASVSRLLGRSRG